MKVYLRIREGQLSEENSKKGKLRKDSLYLVFYDSTTNKPQYEFLKLYVYDKPKTENEKIHNKETLKLADTIKSQRILDLQYNKHGFISGVRGKIDFVKYFKTLVDKRINSEGNYGNWLSTFHHLENFCKGAVVEIDKVDDLFLERFKEYLLNEKISIKKKNSKVSQNSALSYFNKVKTALKEAYFNKIIKENPCLRVKGIKEKETNRQYLTLEELQKLAKTDCKCKITKQAFLFSCLTGLRFSDVQKLKWGNLKYDDSNGWSIYYTQQKTKSVEVLPIGQFYLQLLLNITNRRSKYLLRKNGRFGTILKNNLLHKWQIITNFKTQIMYYASKRNRIITTGRGWKYLYHQSTHKRKKISLN